MFRPFRAMTTVAKVEQVAYSDYRKFGVSDEMALRMLRKMLEIRRFEEKVEELFIEKGALIGPSHLYLGEEAIAVGATAAIAKDDLIVTTYRGHGHALAKDVPAKLAMAELFGKATGTCKGIGGSMHVAIYPETGSLYATAIVGSGIPIAAGVALGLKYLKTRRVALVFFGDGAVNTGAFHEGANLASLWKLPLVLICENNQYAMSTRVDRAVAGGSIAGRGAAYGMDSVQVDGNDVVAVFVAIKSAAERARRGEGPTLVECITYKMKGHGVYDKGDYRPKSEVAEWTGRDPVNRFRQTLEKAGLLKAGQYDRILAEVDREMEDAVSFATQSPVLEFNELAKQVYAEAGQ